MIALLLAASCLSAQSGGTDLGEVGAYGGGSFGSTGNHAAVGGNIGLALTRYALLLLDTTYAPLGDRTLVHRPGVQARSSHLYDFNIGVNVRVPVRQQWEPYAVLAPALLCNRYHVETVQPNGTLTYRGRNDWKFGFEIGGGLRHFLTPNWGIRGEYRYVFAAQNFSRITGGVFYQFSEW
jgi:opacity protein-like surface antigen